jgi:AcrR family transcriptional regulator
MLRLMNAAAEPLPMAEPPVTERILETAHELFSRRGIRDVGVDEIIERAGVAKATLYRHFPSKDDLVVAFLERREQRWTIEFIEAEAKSRGATPEEQLLAIFDAFDEWFRREDFEGCSFINTLLELRADHPAGKASIHHLDNIQALVQELAEEAGLPDSCSFAQSFQILMQGSIVSAARGDFDAAHQARAMAHSLIERYRKQESAAAPS